MLDVSYYNKRFCTKEVTRYSPAMWQWNITLVLCLTLIGKASYKGRLEVGRTFSESVFGEEASFGFYCLL